jgi:hypothetical protein
VCFNLSLFFHIVLSYRVSDKCSKVQLFEATS